MNTIWSTVADLVEDENDVVVVMHSLSGIAGGQALEGLDKESRTNKNGQGRRDTADLHHVLYCS